MSNLYRFVTFKRSVLWPELGEWHNFHICDVSRFPGTVEETAIRLVESEVQLHQQHIEFLRVTAVSVDGNPSAAPQDGGDITLPGDSTARVYAMAGNNRFGALATDAEGCEFYTLRISKDTPGARNGYIWFRGCLGNADIIKEDSGTVRLKDVDRWRNRVFYEYAFPFGFEPDRFRVHRQGKNSIKLGEYQPVDAFTVRGMNIAGAITRAIKRRPASKQAHYNAIMYEIDLLCYFWSQFRSWRFLGTDYNPVEILEYAMEMMALCLAISKEVIKCLLEDLEGQCGQDSPYNTRFGPTSGDLIGFASLAAKPICEAPEPTEKYNKDFEKLVQVAADINVPSGTFFSQAQLSKMEDIFRKYVLAAFEMARGDYLPTLPRPY